MRLERNGCRTEDTEGKGHGGGGGEVGSAAGSHIISSLANRPEDAIKNVRGWWSEEIEGRTDQLGAEFEFRYRDFHRGTQKITEFVPDKKVVWHVSDARINFVKDKTEWNGTDVVFEITRTGDKTELCFTHVGLVPTIECYGDCSGAWGFYIKDSLQSLITTGEGRPAKKEEAGPESCPLQSVTLD